MSDVERSKRGRPKKQETVKQFTGFSYPAPKGYSAFPNVWFDEIISQIDNLAEQKVVLYIFRHTYGYQKDKAFVHITVDEFMHGRLLNGERVDRGTGLSDMAVRKGRKLAIQHGYIEYRTDGPANDTQMSYRLKFSGVNIIYPEVNIIYPEVNNKQVQGEITITPGGKYHLPPQARSITTNTTNNNQINDKERKNAENQHQLNGDEENTLIRSSQLTSEQHRIDGYYCQHYPSRPPTITEKLKRDYDTLAQYIHTQEQMDSLIRFVKVRISGNDPRVHPGNLVYWLDTWREEQQNTMPEQPATSLEEEQPYEDKSLVHGYPPEYWTEERLATIHPVKEKVIRNELAERFGIVQI